MNIHLLLNCIILNLFITAAGLHLWNVMHKEIHKKLIMQEAIVGLVTLVLWVSSEANFLM